MTAEVSLQGRTEVVCRQIFLSQYLFYEALLVQQAFINQIIYIRINIFKHPVFKKLLLVLVNKGQSLSWYLIVDSLKKNIALSMSLFLASEALLSVQLQKSFFEII
jgi:hypothetical protein